MYRVIRQALALVDRWTRRRLGLSIVMSMFLAVLETSAFALIYVVISIASDSDRQPATKYPFLKHVFGSNPSRSNVITVLAIVSGCVFVSKSVISAFVARWQSGFTAVTEARLATRLFSDYVSRDYLFHAERNSAVLMRNLTDSVTVLCGSVIGGLASVMTDGAVLAGIFVALIVANPPVALGLAAYIGLLSAGYLFGVARLIHRAYWAEQELSRSTLQLMQETFAGIKTVKAYGVPDAIDEQYSAQRRDLAQARKTIGFAQKLPQYYLEVGTVVGISLAAIVALSGERSNVGTLLALLVAAALRALPSVNRVLSSLNSIRGAAPAVDNLLAITPSSASPRPRLDRALALEPRKLSLKNVTFNYPNSPDSALADFNMDFEFGRSYGIVGRSGAGKSTLIDILMALLNPSSGHLEVDGEHLTDNLHVAWRAAIGYVPQETFLLDASVRDNIRFFRGGYEDADIWRCLESAHLKDHIEKLPEGLNSSVGERGVKLSGGQRQRLGIARALLTTPSFLILDEATSALDGPTERAVTQTITSLHGQVTTITIAHRLSTVSDCDQILLLADGRVSATGTFDELLTMSETFSDMVQHASLRGVDNAAQQLNVIST